jgi:hypothetical protein
MPKWWHVHGSVFVGPDRKSADFTITVHAEDDADAQAFVFDLLGHHEHVQVDVDVCEIEPAEGWV